MADRSQDPLRPFRSRRGRWMAMVAAVAMVVVFSMIGWEASSWNLPDRIAAALAGVAIASFLWRYAMIRAVPDRSGMTVRNLFTTQRVEWDQVTGVRFSPGDPWARLTRRGDEELAVMAIQAADGRSSEQEAARLAGIVQALSPAARRPRPDDAPAP
ncbi:PH domain-containing protein [Kytococcus aerolatus]|uniref:PH domain-containing protein n=1 Tax=Kytococcus aerolatus TaxID=592308 RepID=A0A212T0N8_9MICO|nr:PH domain-containing protein [Kytococcus aerolatus]SNC59334.1 PH domain-containing protein [Kytococcus aerolatus]